MTAARPTVAHPVDPPPPTYARSGYDADAIHNAITALDHVARTAEQTWGVGRLRCLVDDELRGRFDRQRLKVDQLIWRDDVPSRDVVPQIDAMRRGWAALDAAARAAGASPKPPEVWEVRQDDGSVIAIVRDNADASMVRPDGRQIAVYTLAEVARLLAAYPAIAKVKHAFEGATVERAVRHESDLPPLDWVRGDELPI